MTIDTPFDYACMWLGRSTVCLCVAVGLIAAVRLLAIYVGECVGRRRDYWQQRNDVAKVDQLVERFTGCPKRATSVEQTRRNAAIERELQDILTDGTPQ